MRYSYKTKMNVIKKYYSGMSIKDLSQMFGIPKPTISYWIRKDKEKKQIKQTNKQINLLNSIDKTNNNELEELKQENNKLKQQIYNIREVTEEYFNKISLITSSITLPKKISSKMIDDLFADDRFWEDVKPKETKRKRRHASSIREKYQNLGK